MYSTSSHPWVPQGLSKGELEELHQELTQMLDSPVWTIFLRWLEDQQANHHRVLLDAGTNIEQIRIAQGAYNAIKLVQSAPRVMQTTLLALRANTDE